MQELERMRVVNAIIDLLRNLGYSDKVILEVAIGIASEMGLPSNTPEHGASARNRSIHVPIDELEGRN